MTHSNSTAVSSSEVPGEVLRLEDVFVGLSSTSMEEAIEFVGGKLVERGVVLADYVTGMKNREETVSTYLGNGVAMPHGTLEFKSDVLGTGIVVAQYPDGVDWGAGTAHLVIGLAAIGNDHVNVLAQMAEVLQEEELCEQLWVSTDAAMLHHILSTPPDDDDDDEAVTSTVTISNSTGLHARPATLIVELTKSLSAEVTILKGEKKAKASSIMSVLALGAVVGDVVTISAEGSDAARAIESITTILTTNEEA